jgi:hypothetical protein
MSTRLTASGIADGQARALADGLDQALREEVATKTDLAALRQELKAEIQLVKHDLLRWMVGMAFAQVGLAVALIRFLPH